MFLRRERRKGVRRLMQERISRENLMSKWGGMESRLLQQAEIITVIKCWVNPRTMQEKELKFWGLF